jgi:AAA domain
MESDSHSAILATSERACLTAPAGCGKTELIARAVGQRVKGRQLVLTHTHAGVKALRDRLRKLGVPTGYYHVDTIAGWSLRYALAFPGLSGLESFHPQAEEWHKVYAGAARLLQVSTIKKIVSYSYSGMYVDEYQDCALPQHQIVLKLANIIPCRVVGDPLQGLFDFEGSIVDWSTDVIANFPSMPPLTKPWRWFNANPELGQWLVRFRRDLLSGSSVDLQSAPLRWRLLSPPEQRAVCFSLASAAGSVVAIEKWPHSAHKLASGLKGSFTSMEEMECKDLLSWCEKIENATGGARAIAVIDFAATCLTKVSTELAKVKAKIASGDASFARLQKHKSVAVSLQQLISAPNIDLIGKALDAIRRIEGSILYRRELWNEMKRVIANYEAGNGGLNEVAWLQRNRASVMGRLVERRVVSRTLLVKGLEFDHAVVINADTLNAKELYVAMTRGSKSLTVLSSSPTILKEIPTNIPRES